MQITELQNTKPPEFEPTSGFVPSMMLKQGRNH